ncbi:UDP-N-acetylmuramate dehydrogenase [Marinobacterium lutimaris]|uniref:UDP-N-acetylenolpyruvoylglucosamine reductase n=1 Tax=Marinobacterium lutimaris TaxID=568106 RepID=A0A1H5WHC8_9GAMM|nr:UDP-N-acetylmuramate dehydrogenase [Marinobacterium lutimaris]SEF98696.1 UDP-N-acetylmuramate dehydrogenase [Marinobacterium lutimaris]
MSLEFHREFSLTGMNTLGFEVTAERFVRIQTQEQVSELHAELKRSGDPLLLLGGGSNLVLSARIPGIVAQMDLRGCEVEELEGASVRVTLGGGEHWHGAVSSLLEQGIYGLENLALIPGSVGAAPVQNIGAYGVEVKDRIDAVQVYDWQQERIYWLDNCECEFAYRDSRFKRESGRYLILRVRFLLSRIAATVTTYAPLQARLSTEEQQDPRAVFRTVCDIRREKLPDPERLGNAGSFFKNPVVDGATYERIKAAYPDLVAYPDIAGFKLAAGWLIDRCGWKGRKMASVGVHDQQALVLVNLGDGDRSQLEKLATAIQADILETYGVVLEPEPRFYP